MNELDLAQVARWRREPHIVEWWAHESPETTIEKYRRRIAGELPTTMLTIVEDGRLVGWCQWYRWADYPADAEAMQAEPDDCGIDYALGETSALNRGLGTEAIGLLVDELRRIDRTVSILVAPEERNLASRRALEKNGFELVEIRPVATEPTDAPMALYRWRARRDSNP